MILILFKMSYYPQPDSYDRTEKRVELDLSNYATKPDIKKHQQ